MPSRALAGLKILDLSRVLAAPLATQLLGDLGAEIIKVERPGLGDESREYGPPFMKDRDGNPTTDSAFYLSCNRNKRSITIDLATEDGQSILRELARRSDVVVENFKTGALKKYGLDYESLHAVNPALIYCSVTGFGQTGPFAHKPGYDGIFQAMSGFMSASGRPDGEPGAGPMKVGLSMIDILTSFYATVGILSALYHRDARGGAGQHIDLALLDCGLASLSHFAMSYLVSGAVPPRRGNGGFGGVPSQAFACIDGDIFIVAGNNSFFSRLCDALDHPEIFRDPRFATTAARIENRDALVAVLSDIFAGKTLQEWLDRLEEAEVPASAVNELPAALASPQIRHRGMVQRIEHPVAGAIDILRNPIRLSETPIEGYAPPPSVGADTDAILQELGYERDAVESLRARKIV